jgi:sugar lactone lactonase YvrE
VDVTKAEQVTGACAEHGEGPFWDAAGDRLLFVDLERGAVLATGRGFRLLTPALAPVSDEIVAFDDPAIRMNDGGCDPQGRFYCGSMAYDFTPCAGALFRLDPDLSVRRVLSGVTVSNGIHWHRQTTACTFGGPDRATLFITTSRRALAPRRRPAPYSRSGLESVAGSCQPSQAEPRCASGDQDGSARRTRRRPA